MHHQRNKLLLYGAVFAITTFATWASQAHADAIVVTRAMRASTIAEVFVNENEVSVKIEIGADDVAAFANILPDDFYERIAGKVSPLEERIPTFFESDWVMIADGQPLSGELLRVVPAKRVIRDEVTGDPLIEQSEDAESVIRVELRYPLTAHPRNLAIRPPGSDRGESASIGFICYHDGLPVNDFRYLSQQVTLDLDWDDPWYSRFRHPNLRRTFDSPLSAYLYIEPYEVRQEVIVRPKDLQTWVDLGIGDNGVIPADRQAELKNRVARFLLANNPVTIDGKVVPGQLDRIHFIHRTLRTTGIIEPPVDLDVTSATLGVIFVYPIDELPEKVSIEWELFSPKIQSIPAVASDEAGGLPMVVTPEDSELVWNNYLTNPTLPQMMAVTPPPKQQQFKVPVFSAFCGVALVLLLGWQWTTRRKISSRVLATSLALAAAGIVTLPFARLSVVNRFAQQETLSEQGAQELLSALLHNVYRSFDHHDESLIYDRLSKSIAGELLSDVYLDTRKSMEVKNQGGMRISVKEVIVTDLDRVSEIGTDPTFRCHWRVAGWVGHWGHIHARANQRVAQITVSPRDGRWKITNIEIMDEQSLDPTQNESSI